MKILGVIAIALTLLGSILAVPAPALVTSDAETDYGTFSYQNADPDLRLPSFGTESEETPSHFLRDTDTFSGCSVHWARKIEWLGFRLGMRSSKQGVEDTLQKNSERSLFPESTSLILRYPKGQVRPYVWISPNNLVSASGVNLNFGSTRFLLGLSYSF
ncbi:MAG: hypothetical protein JSU72_15450 [Deltaproteobacteria bacterium]|nr:MAG: hypothetical protein JSU72_15450 [Deltaproteobacteria bacterium]